MSNLNVLDTELETARKIFWLLSRDHIFLSTYNNEKTTWDDGAYPVINCNDVFVPGADAEPLSAEDLDLYIQVMKTEPDYGSYAWCAVKRNQSLWRLPKNPEHLKKYEHALHTVKTILKIGN